MTRRRYHARRLWTAHRWCVIDDQAFLTRTYIVEDCDHLWPALRRAHHLNRLEHHLQRLETT